MASIAATYRPESAIESESDFRLTTVFEEGGKHFLYDGCSGLVAKVSPQLAERLAFLSAPRHSGGCTLIRSALAFTDEVSDEITRLRDRGFFAKPIGEYEPVTDTTDLPGVTEAYLCLTSACNLRCGYCYDRGRRDSVQAMSPRTLARSLDLLLKYADQKGLTIVLWGGEPLLHEDLVALALEEIRRRRSQSGVPVRVATTTNCTTLTPSMVSLLVRHQVVVNLSLDGDPESHNRYRLRADGRGCYAEIIANVRHFTETYAKQFPTYVPRARLTVTSPTVARLASNYFHLWAMGIPVVWAKNVDFVPATHPAALTCSDTATLTAQFGLIRDEVSERVLRHDQTVLPQVWMDLHEIHQRVRRPAACAAGFTGISIMPDGVITACYHLSQQGPGYALGHVEDGTLDPSIRLRFANRALRAVAEGHCRHAARCGGGCFAKAVLGLGQPLAPWPPHCDFAGSYFDHCLKMYARLMSSPEAGAVRKLLHSRPVESSGGIGC